MTAPSATIAPGQFFTRDLEKELERRRALRARQDREQQRRRPGEPVRLGPPADVSRRGSTAPTPRAGLASKAAVHEAGHAVVAHWAKLFSGDVSIDRKGNGRCALNRKNGAEWWGVVACIAGSIAERGSASGMSSSDSAVANKLLNKLFRNGQLPGSCKTTSDAFLVAEYQAELLVAGLTPHIRAVAAAIEAKGRLVGYEVAEIYAHVDSLHGEERRAAQRGLMPGVVWLN